ncbi:MFS transporter [Burkholderia gladioli]|jgi:D-galactonate transporter|uniref:Putative tartrate transporter n=1 Tax=Burkholderia gladioli TaxID=28095 RepID=A0AB38U2L8_BURGA|nr:MFS transporter [Burkholderia gladioli]KAF1058437.1 putative tartrate transporter [Burkholderia gladioli]MBA1360278.1 MFS transporter [Burkholderia gladioli]MBU9177637.1 MFS transporter [Burkholderia gladioli]MBU9273609.1 MFS transporter [Burkholderia gladioli]MBU9322809.1 MFS transporter [Burkholderia gladioli]
MSTHPAIPMGAARPSADATFRRAAWRFMPLLFICYVVAYLDRVNVGFAKLQMLGDLHFSEAVYGFGAGLFFVGYFFFEVPSNLLLHRLGARRWIARIMVSWAVLSLVTAWVTTPTMFYVVRFLLGVAEAGFFPGMILYLTYWFPSHRRGKMVAVLMAGNPVSGIVGGPLSGYIMHAFNGAAGHAGWQWLFVVEALPAIVLGVVIYFFLDDRVEQARWLSEHEKAVIADEVGSDAAVRTHGSVGAVFGSARVWLLCLILFGIVMGSYAIGFWQPTIIRNSGVADPFMVGLLTVIPYACALVAMLLVGRHADRTRERRWHVGAPALLAAAGFCLCAFGGNSLMLAMIGLTLATVGVICALPMFWALPTSFLGGTGAAAGIALINSTGNLAGFVSPAAIGWLKTQTHTLSSGLYLVAGTLTLSALLIVVFLPARIVNR